MFSFDFAKMITCGEGGLTLTNNSIYGKYIREYIDHGHENNPNLERGHDNRIMSGFNYRMTELQAAIASAQLKKLTFLVDESFKRYNILNNRLSKHFRIRKEFEGHTGSYDTFIFRVDNIHLRKNIIDKLIEVGFGTKILPDAMEWHCSAYWGHALEEDQVKHSKKTLELLEKHVSIPILVKKSEQEYISLANKLEEVLKSE